MFEVKVNYHKNRLYIKLAKMENGEAEKAANEVINSVVRLRKGFTVINDISDFIPVDESDQEYITKAQKHVLQAGVSRVVRVVGDTIFGQMQMNRKSREVGYTADTFPSLREAEKVLDLSKEVALA